MTTIFHKNIATLVDHLLKSYFRQDFSISVANVLFWSFAQLDPPDFGPRSISLQTSSFLWEEDVNKNKDLVADFLFSSLYSKLWQELFTLCCATKDTYAGLQFCVCFFSLSLIQKCHNSHTGLFLWYQFNWTQLTQLMRIVGAYPS